MIGARKWASPGLAIGAIALALAGCNYFKPEQPEAPGGASGGLIRTDYTFPDSTLETMRRAVEAKASRGGEDAYRQAFSDSSGSGGGVPAYHHFWWPEEAANWVAQGHSIPSNWTLNPDEASFYDIGERALVNLRPDSLSMQWAPEAGNPDQLGSGVVTLHRHYLIRSIGSDGSTTDIIAKGYADLILVQGPDNAWRIMRWNDRPDPVVDPVFIQKTLGLRRLEWKGG
jgi:hypothetical protein